MSEARLEFVDAGIAASIQDLGRRGQRSVGVPLSGAADPLLLACANALLAQPHELAALEIGLVGPVLQALLAPVPLAWVGDFAPRLEREGEPPRPLASWRGISLQPGERLIVGPCRSGIGYLALGGGFEVPVVLGSRSTYPRAALGGIEGRAPRAGDQLDCAAARGPDRCAPRPFVHPGGALRVLRGPQDEHFDAAALAQFASVEWRVSREADRMGIRLEGPSLAHRRGADIVSEAVTPGAVQVPGSGQPIVLGVDAQTVGGYPKIATLISADLPRLAHARPGAVLRFEFISREEALAARRAQHAALLDWVHSLQPCREAGDIDEAALFTANLISGMIDADAEGAPATTAATATGKPDPLPRER